MSNQQEQNQNYVDYIDLGLDDEDKAAWDGRTSRVDPGEYALEVVDAVRGTSNAGNTTLRVEYKVIDDSPMRGRKFPRWYNLNPDNTTSCRRINNLLTALGAPTDERRRFSPASLIGLRMYAEVVPNTYTKVDSRSGEAVERQGIDLIGERPYDGGVTQPQYVQQPQYAPQQQYAPQPQYAPPMQQQQPQAPQYAPQAPPQPPPRPAPQQQPPAPQQAQPQPPPPQGQQPVGQPVATRRPGNQQPRVR